MDARIFAALGDPTRLDLLVHLAENSPKTATELTPSHDRGYSSIFIFSKMRDWLLSIKKGAKNAIP